MIEIETQYTDKMSGLFSYLYWFEVQIVTQILLFSQVESGIFQNPGRPLSEESRNF